MQHGMVAILTLRRSSAVMRVSLVFCFLLFLSMTVS